MTSTKRRPTPTERKRSLSIAITFSQKIRGSNGKIKGLNKKRRRTRLMVTPMDAKAKLTIRLSSPMTI
jgi:hypothetical protein